MEVIMHGRKLAMDAEANGLLEKVTKMWCIVATDMDTDEVFIFHNFPQYNNARIYDPFDDKTYVIPKRNGTLEDGVKFIMGAGQIICHNYYGYDYFLMKKFYPWFKHDFDIVRDTLIQSRLQMYDRQTPKGCRGNHGLEAWGARRGIKKPAINDWSTMDAMKLHRCIEDNKIQVFTYWDLEKERGRLEGLVGTSTLEALEHEHRYRFVATVQEMTGACVDKDHMEKCIKELDKFCEDLRVKIEPLLPKTIKYKGAKETGNFVATVLGYENPPKIKYISKTKVGVKKLYPVKSWHKPVTKWLNTIKGKTYIPTDNKGHTYGVAFNKLKEARDWTKEHFPLAKGTKYPSTPFERLVYNDHTCEHFNLEPEDYNNREDFHIDGPFTKLEWLDSKMSQHAIVKKMLAKHGWEPTEWNHKKDSDGKYLRDARGRLIRSSPKLTEDSYDSIEGDGIGRDIAHFNTYAHRRKFIANPTDPEKGLLNRIRPDGRVSCSINSYATSTGRSSHGNWVNAAGVGKLYGEETREIIVPEGDNVLVGADMKSAQLSIAAYYAGNYDYYMSVVEGEENKLDSSGQEILHPDTGKPWYTGESGHCVNARMFEIVSEDEWQDAVRTQDPALLHSIMLRRKLSKGGTFATLFGATGKKVATTLGIPESLGEQKRHAFLNNIGLDDPIARLGVQMKKYSRGGGGYLELPFGYWTYCKQKHKVFNYLDQGTEAVCQKIAVVYFEQELAKLIKKGHIKAKKVLDYHDEYLVESHLDCADDVGRLMCESYKYASDRCLEWHQQHSQWFKHLQFAFNLDGGYKIGTNYLKVH